MKLCGSFHITPEPGQGSRPIVPHYSSLSPGVCLGPGSAQCEYTIRPVSFSSVSIVWNSNQKRWSSARRRDHTMTLHWYTKTACEENHDVILPQWIDLLPSRLRIPKSNAVYLSDVPGVWQKILEPFEKMRVDSDLVKCFPSYLSGEDLFGLTEPTVIRIVESVSTSTYFGLFVFLFSSYMFTGNIPTYVPILDTVDAAQYRCQSI